MSTPTPPKTRSYDGLPPVALELKALLDFNRNMDQQLVDFEKRFYRRREHAISSPSEPMPSRMTAKKPRKPK